MDCKARQFEKALLPIEVIESGKITVFKDVQPEKVSEPIDVKAVQLEKSTDSIVVLFLNGFKLILFYCFQLYYLLYYLM